MTIPIRGKPIFHRMYYIVRNNHEEGCISPLQRPHYFTSSYTHNNFEKSDYCIVLQKISCTRQFESQLSLRSFALSFRVKDFLSALIHLIGFLNIVTCGATFSSNSRSLKLPKLLSGIADGALLPGSESIL